MPTGRVKWFNGAKGYGFILSEGEGPDYFAHYSSILMDGYRSLKAGQPVSFDLLEGPKGAHAINIKLLEEDTTRTDSPDVYKPDNPDTNQAEIKTGE